MFTFHKFDYFFVHFLIFCYLKAYLPNALKSRENALKYNPAKLIKYSRSCRRLLVSPGNMEVGGRVGVTGCAAQ